MVKKTATEPVYQSLAYYTEKAATMTDVEIHYARLDIAKTIAVRPDLDPQHPYMAKLLNERDAILTEISKRHPTKP